MNSVQIKENTWLSIIIYIDYNTNFAYYKIPSTGYAIKTHGVWYDDVPSLNTNAIFIDLFCDNTSVNDRTAYFVKYYNLVLSAINTLPKLNIEYNDSKFNLHPNPSTNLVNITNSENLSIKKN